MEQVFKKVYDLGAGAYLMMHGYKAIRRTKDKAIVFSITAADVEEFDEKQIDYLNSEYHRFDSCLMSLKKLSVYEEK
jgi:predicted secreted Zn-dependent protease